MDFQEFLEECSLKDLFPLRIDEVNDLTDMNIKITDRKGHGQIWLVIEGEIVQAAPDA